MSKKPADTSSGPSLRWIPVSQPYQAAAGEDLRLKARARTVSDTRYRVKPVEIVQRLNEKFGVLRSFAMVDRALTDVHFSPWYISQLRRRYQHPLPWFVAPCEWTGLAEKCVLPRHATSADLWGQSRLVNQSWRVAEDCRAHHPSANFTDAIGSTRTPQPSG